jgi:tetratricopeptide (TPR) repeat protein
LGVAFEASQDSHSARQWWERAAGQKGDFQEMSVRSHSELTYYSALALARLGRSKQAEELLRLMLVYAEGLMRQEAKIDYFATSLPAMLLFEDDLQKRNRATATFLEAQAWLGLGDSERAQQLLKRLLDLDPSHALGADLLQQLEEHSAALSMRS